MNSIYDGARYKLLTADFNWPAMDLRLVAWGAIPDFVATDKMVSDITSRGNVILSYSMPITVTTVTPDGTAQTNQVVIPGIAVGQNITWLTMVNWTSPDVASGQPLLFIDDAVDMPFPANGLDVVVQPDWLENRGWFRP